MVYLSKYTIVISYDYISSIDANKEQGLTQKVSALKYLAALDMYFKNKSVDCDLKTTENKELFASYVGEVVRINNEISTKDFYTNISPIGRDYDCGSNFYSQSSVKDSKNNRNETFLYPKRSGWKPVMDVKDQILIRREDYIKDAILFYLPAKKQRIGFLLWLLRDKGFNEENVHALKAELLRYYTEAFCDALFTSLEDEDFDYLEFSETKVSIEKNDIDKLHGNLSSSGTKNIKLPLQKIVYGAPGTGKSFSTDDKIKEIYPSKEEQKNNVFRTTFHPDSDYSTFVGAYKPTMVKAKQSQVILDYDSLVDKYKEYIEIKKNMTIASTLMGYEYHDSIVKMQPQHTIGELVADAYKNNTTYDSVLRGGMAVYESNPSTKSDKITYSFVPQTFTKAYIQAWRNYIVGEKKPVFLVIEEINRGNCAQIFGDLFQLLDRDDDTGMSSYPIKPDTDLGAYLADELKDIAHKATEWQSVVEGEYLLLPSNLHIWATMNTSDQSLFPIDSAFKRRWDWKYVRINEGKGKDKQPLNFRIQFTTLEGEKVDESWWDFIQKINEKIEVATKSEDKKLGYFFCKPDKKANETDKDNTIISAETFVGKVVFYLWQDVFKDYGFKSDIFKKDGNARLAFHDFYPHNIEPDEEKNPEGIDLKLVKKFIDKVMDRKPTPTPTDTPAAAPATE